MASVNIGQDNQGDAFYRYKMPVLQARIEGRGNGIKTNVINNVDIAKALERPPEYIVKWYGCELGALTKFDAKDGTSIVNGAHDTSKLKESLEKFIKTYVQCYACGNPETIVKVKRDFITLKCKACGEVSDVDMRHKLNTYILKNPPEEKVSKEVKKLKKAEKDKMKEMAAAAETQDKEARRKARKEKKERKEREARGEGPEGDEGDDGDDHDEAQGGDEVVWTTDTSASAQQARAQEQLTDAMAMLATAGNDDAAARQKAEAEAEAEAADPVKRLRKAVQAGLQPKDAVALLNELADEGGTAVRMRLLYQALFEPCASGQLAPALQSHVALLKAAGSDPAGQVAHLVALEFLLSQRLPPAETPTALKVLYDEDVVDEDFLQAWYTKPSAAKVLEVPAEGASAVRKAAEPFITWLEQAEEDASDEDEE